MKKFSLGVICLIFLFVLNIACGYSDELSSNVSYAAELTQSNKGLDETVLTKETHATKVDGNDVFIINLDDIKFGRFTNPYNRDIVLNSKSVNVESSCNDLEISALFKKEGQILDEVVLKPKESVDIEIVYNYFGVETKTCSYTMAFNINRL